jgi:adenylate kinase family enzyme
MMGGVLNYISTIMLNNFMLFSDLQKRLTPSPIKSWRLLKQLRDEGRMRETDDWMMQDRKLFVNVLSFIVELEQLGYGNLKSDEIRNGNVISDDIKQLVDKMKLISSEITERSIQEEMKSDDFTTDNSKPYFSEQEQHVKSPQQNLKSNEINNSNLKSDDFTFASREIIDAKNEVIDTLKESIRSKEDDVAQLRSVISDLTQQLKTTSQQNAWLTNLLVAPKQENEPMRSTKVTDITNESDEISDFTDDITDEDDLNHETNTQQNTSPEELNQEQSTDEITPDEEMQSAN